MREMRLARLVGSAFALLTTVAAVAAAQGGTIQGTVTATGSGAPLQETRVVVVGREVVFRAFVPVLDNGIWLQRRAEVPLVVEGVVDTLLRRMVVPIESDLMARKAAANVEAVVLLILPEIDRGRLWR